MKCRSARTYEVLLPAEGFNHVADIASHDFVDRCQGVSVGDALVVQSRPEEVLRGIGQKELYGRCGVALKIVIHAIDAGFGVGVTLFGDSVRFDGVVEDHTDALVGQMTKGADV